MNEEASGMNDALETWAFVYSLELSFIILLSQDIGSKTNLDGYATTGPEGAVLKPAGHTICVLAAPG